MNLNKTILVGRVTRQPEVRVLPSGSKVATFSLATNRMWSQEGQKKEETTFHNIVAFGHTAETIGQYVIQGQEILVEGRISNRSYDDKDGKKAYRSEVILETFQFGQKPKGAENSKPVDKEGWNGIKGKDEDPDPIEYPDEEVNLEDIPF
jgi:single-strand DNA-binding protein